MDNYLSARWPSQQPAPQRQKQPKQQRRKRRVWRDVLIVAAALLVLCGLIVGSFFGVQWAAERYAVQLPDLPALPSGDNSGKQDLPGLPDIVIPTPGSVSDWTADLLPKGAADPGAMLELRSREGETAMAANEIYKKVLPSIVCVEAYNQAGSSVGSGIVLSQSGYILTNYHVVEGGLGLAVMRLSDRAIFDNVTLVGYDKELDLAILKAEGDDFVPAELGSSDELETGDTVYAIGNPLGYLYGAMSDGIVSALEDGRISELDYPGRLIQTTAALNSGNSGGALVDAYGRVVGITYAKVTGVREDVVVEGLGLAIPLSDAKPYLERIYRTGQSARPSIGISCYAAELDGVPGILVAEVTKGTPAFGKILPDDFILSANGVPATSVDAMTRVFAYMEAGDPVELVVLRQGKEITVIVELYDRLPEIQ